MATGTDDSNLARVVVSRDSERDIKMRSLNVFLDGESWLDLKFGTDAETAISPGHHVLKVTNTVFSSKCEFDVSAGETVRFSAGNITRGLGAIMFVVFGMGIYSTFLHRL
jgi:hypothetical protein